MSTTQDLENKLPVKNILLALFMSINFCFLVSRSVMESVGNNDGKDCPNVGGPAFACTLYGLSFLMLIGMIIKNKDKLNGVKIGAFALLSILTLSIFIAYIPFTVKAQSHNSATDTECLTSYNKDAIEKMELIISGVLVILPLLLLYVL